jgi:hypothetical protein
LEVSFLTVSNLEVDFLTVGNLEVNFLAVRNLEVNFLAVQNLEVGFWTLCNTEACKKNEAPCLEGSDASADERVSIRSDRRNGSIDKMWEKGGGIGAGGVLFLLEKFLGQF